MNRLDASSPIPLYHQLRGRVLDRVTSGEFLPGERIPTEHEICEAYGVSRTTARQALSSLVDDGVIERARRRGSIVSPSWRSSPEGAELKMVISDGTRADQIIASTAPEKNLSIDVVPYDRIHQHLMRSVSEGDAPDIAMIDHVWIAEFAENHMIYPLDELTPSWAKDLVTDKLHEAVASGYHFEGSLYAIPEEVNLAGIWYDTNALDSVGADIPSTWEELVAAATLIREKGIVKHPITMPGGEAAQETTTYCLAAMLASNGARIMNDAVRLDSPAAVATLRLIRSFVTDGLMDPEVITHTWLEGPRLLAAGEAAIAIGGSYELEHIAREVGESTASVRERFVFAAFPGGPLGGAATAIGGMGHVVFRQSSDPLRAMDLIEEVMSQNVFESRAAEHWTVSPFKSMDRPSSPEAPFVTGSVAMLANATTRPIVPGYQPVTRQLQRMVQSIISGSMRPAAAVERTAEFIGAMTDVPVVRP
jgi:multiple sugar transport system substrate-binding protein